MNGRIKNMGQPASKVGFPIVGKIKIGEKLLSQNGKEYPVSRDYFIPTGPYAGLFLQAYGEKPQTIQVVFPTDDASKVCIEEYEYRDSAGKLVASGDGETFKVWSKDQYKTLTTEEFPDLMNMVAREYPSPTGWKVTLTLNFIIPLVRGVMGVWQFSTKGSLSTVPNVRDAFDSVLEVNGKVRGVIFDLSVKFAKSQHPGAASKFPVVSLVANESEANLRVVNRANKPIQIQDAEASADEQ